MTPGAFRTARVAPVLGRGLQDADAAPGAPAVVVLGYDLWQRSLGGRPDVVGSIVQFGGTPATVVGVMPEGFAYPYNQQAWAPLQLRAAYGPLEGERAERHRQAGAWCHSRAGRCRAAGAQRARGVRVSGHARAITSRVVPLSGDDVNGRGAVRGEKRTRAARAARRVHERGHTHLRAHGDARG